MIFLSYIKSYIDSNNHQDCSVFKNIKIISQQSELYFLLISMMVQ